MLEGGKGRIYLVTSSIGLANEVSVEGMRGGKTRQAGQSRTWKFFKARIKVWTELGRVEKSLHYKR